MKKLFAALLIPVLAFDTCFGGTISRTYNYTDGNAISANENNTNENTIVNEINGNLSTANILDGTLLNGDFADTQIAVTKFASIVQSTFTYVRTFGTYRRPVLVYVSASTIDIENNTGTSNETCVQFPDERRCVTENTASTSVNRRFIITEDASVSGTKNSGLRSQYVETANTWYSLYAIKVTDNSTDFVIAGDTVTPTQANYAALNTQWGTNSWVYLGVIPYGDNSAATTTIPKFFQAGNQIQFYNVLSAVSNSMIGVKLATVTGATSLTWTYAVGTTLSSGQLPGQILIGNIQANNTGTTVLNFTMATGGASVWFGGTGQLTPLYLTGPIYLGNGFKSNPAGSVNIDIVLSGYFDSVLGVGYNPQL